jgi:hypothetical protein
MKKDDLLRANPQQLFRDSTLLEPPSTRHSDVEKRAIVSRVTLATLYVLMLGVTVGEFVKLLDLALNSLEQLLGFGVAGWEGGLDSRGCLSPFSERASVASSPILGAEG